SDSSTSQAPTLQAKPMSGSLVYAMNVPTEVALDRAMFLEPALRWITELAAIEGKDRRAFAAPVRALEFDLGETRGDVSMRLAVTATSGTDADSLERLLRASIAHVPSSGIPDVERRRTSLLEPLRVESPDTRLVVSYRCNASKFVEDLTY